MVSEDVNLRRVDLFESEKRRFLKTYPGIVKSSKLSGRQ
jgi:hypothetical protein